MVAVRQLHHDLRRSRAVFRTFVSNPVVWRRDRVPEEGLWKEIAKCIQNAQMGNKFELVAFEIARRSLDALLAPKLKSDAVQPGFVGQKMGRKGMALMRLKEPGNARNRLDAERVRGHGQGFDLRACG